MVDKKKLEIECKKILQNNFYEKIRWHEESSNLMHTVLIHAVKKLGGKLIKEDRLSFYRQMTIPFKNYKLGINLYWRQGELEMKAEHKLEGNYIDPAHFYAGFDVVIPENVSKDDEKDVKKLFLNIAIRAVEDFNTLSKVAPRDRWNHPGFKFAGEYN